MLQIQKLIHVQIDESANKNFVKVDAPSNHHRTPDPEERHHSQLSPPRPRRAKRGKERKNH